MMVGIVAVASINEMIQNPELLIPSSSTWRRRVIAREPAARYAVARPLPGQMGAEIVGVLDSAALLGLARE